MTQYTSKHVAFMWEPRILTEDSNLLGCVTMLLLRSPQHFEKMCHVLEHHQVFKVQEDGGN